MLERLEGWLVNAVRWLVFAFVSLNCSIEHCLGLVTSVPSMVEAVMTSAVSSAALTMTTYCSMVCTSRSTRPTHVMRFTTAAGSMELSLAHAWLDIVLHVHRIWIVFVAPSHLIVACTTDTWLFLTISEALLVRSIDLTSSAGALNISSVML